MSLLSQQLSFRSRYKLAQILDQENMRGCDWRTLVELMGFSYEMVMMLRTKESPTMSLLEEWELREGSDATLNSLIIMVEELENAPAILLLKQIKEDIESRPLPQSPNTSPRKYHNHSSSSDHQSHENTPSKPYIDPINIHTNGLSLQHQLHSLSICDEGPVTSVDKEEDTMKKEEDELKDEDIMRGRALSDLDRILLRGHEFDIFLSFAPADVEFAEEMRLRLMTRACVSVYIASEGMMPGQCFQDEIADKIKRGCRKTIIILSPDYNKSSWCNYEARLAHHKNPDPRRHSLIPIMYKKCPVPDFIAYLYYLDYSRYKNDFRQCEQYFWDRLYKSVKHQLS